MSRTCQPKNSLSKTFFSYLFFEFFLKSYLTGLLLLGCLRRSTIFRQPCLDSIRYTVVAATSWPSFSSSAFLTWFATNMPPLEAAPKNPAKKSFSSSSVKYSRRVPSHFFFLTSCPQCQSLNCLRRRTTVALDRPISSATAGNVSPALQIKLRTGRFATGPRPWCCSLLHGLPLPSLSVDPSFSPCAILHEVASIS